MMLTVYSRDQWKSPGLEESEQLALLPWADGKVQGQKGREALEDLYLGAKFMIASWKEQLGYFSA